jgi:hypothetical protein
MVLSSAASTCERQHLSPYPVNLDLAGHPTRPDQDAGFSA